MVLLRAVVCHFYMWGMDGLIYAKKQCPQSNWADNKKVI